MNSNNNNNLNNHSNLDDAIKPNMNETEFYDEIQLQIKASLKKLSEQYYLYDNKPSLFNYYCSPFINNLHNRNDSYSINRCEENINFDNNYKLLLKCPFESCKDK